MDRVTAAFLLVGLGLLSSVHAFDFPSIPGLTLLNGGEHSGTGEHATDELTVATFEDYLKTNPVTAVLFYAPWCFYSQQIMPVWDEAGQKLKIHDPPVHLAKIDAHRYSSIGDKYGINAFPMMKLFIEGTVYEYEQDAGRTWQAIVKWVNKHIDRDHVLKNIEDADHWLNDNDLTVIGLFGDDHAASKFVKASRHFEDISFAEARGTAISTEIAAHVARHAALACETIEVGGNVGDVASKSVELPREHMTCTDTPRNAQRPDWTDKFHGTIEGKTLTVKRLDKNEGWLQRLLLKCCDKETEEHKANMIKVPVPSVVMFMPHDERFVVYDGDLEDTHNLDRWISARRSPMIMRVTQENAMQLMETGPDKLSVLFLISNTKDDPLEKVLADAAKLVRGRVLVAFSGLSSVIEKRIAELAGVDEQQMPVVVLIEAHMGGGTYHDSKKYRLDTKGLTADKVVNFVSDYENKKLSTYMRSEPIPNKEDSRGPVTVLVGLNFPEVSQHPDQDVLVDFYAPWCGHCRKFEPAYKALAKRLHHVKSLNIAKFDATRNEAQGQFINGFPTIVLFKAGSGTPKEQVLYNGDREVDGMVAWLHHNCGIPFDDKAPVGETTPEPISGLLDASEEADL